MEYVSRGELEKRHRLIILADRVIAYGVVRPNLMKHASGWPTAEHPQTKVAGGQRGFGMAAVGDGKSTSGSERIVVDVEA